MAKKKPNYYAIWAQHFDREVASRRQTADRQKIFDEELAPKFIEGGMNAKQVDALHEQFLTSGAIAPEDIKGFDYLQDEPEEQALVLPSPAAAPSASKPDFSNVEGQAGSTEDMPLVDDLKTTGASLVDSFKNMAARGVDQFNRLPNVRGVFSVVDTLTGARPQDVTEDISASMRDSASDPLRVARTAQLRQGLDEAGGVKGFVGGGLLDAAESPSSFLSLIGGPAGALAMADAYAAAYEQGQRENLSGEALETWALSQAAPELVSVIPAGKAITSLPVIGPLIKNRLTKVATDNLEKRIANPAIRAAAKTAAAAIGEGGEEMLTGTLQDLSSYALAGQTQDEGLAAIGRKNAPVNEEGEFDLGEFAENRYRDFRGGVVGGAAISAPVYTATSVAEASKARAEQNQRSLQDTLKGEKTNADQTTAAYQAERERVLREEAARARQGEQGDMFGTEEGLPSVEEYEAQRQRELEEDAAYRMNNRSRPGATREENLEKVRSSIVARVDTERDLVETLSERVEGGDTSSATLSTLASAQRRLSTAETDLKNFDDNLVNTQEKLAAKKDAPQSQPTAPVEEKAPIQGDMLNDADAVELKEAADRLNAAKKKIEKTNKAKASQDKGNETARKNRLATQVATEHADKTPEQQAQILRDLIADPEAGKTDAAPKEKTTEEKAQAVLNSVEGLRKRQNSERTKRRIRAIHRANPELTAKEIAAQIDAEEGVTAAAPTSTQEELKSKIDKLNKAGDLGPLNMEAETDGADVREQEAASLSKNGPVVPRTAEKQAQHVENVKKLFASLGNTRENVAIRNLIKQGKIVLTDRPESVGRSATRAQGQYEPSEGKTYIYVDNLDTSKPREAVLQAVANHESGHTGQYNPRDGRSEILKSLLGDKGNAAANKLIRDAADKGNKLAQEALENAVAAAEIAKEKGSKRTNVEDLELVPYLLSAAKTGEHAYGTVGRVIRDVKNAANAASRKLFNKDLEFSIDELAAAGERVAEEIVNTEVTGTTEGAALDMTGGRSAKNFQPAKAAGRTYTLPGEFPADSRERFEFSDSNSEFATGYLEEADDALRQARKDGMPDPEITYNLEDAFSHPTLYENYPQLRNFKLTVRDLNGSFGKFYDNDREFVLDSNLVNLAAKIPDATSFAALAEGRNLTNYDFVRDIVLHEVQHAIQGIEGFVGGATTQTPEVNRLAESHKRADKTLSEFVGSVAENIDDMVESLSDSARASWESDLATGIAETNVGKALLFLNNGYAKDAARKWQLVGDRYTNLRDNNVAAASRLDDARVRALEDYRKNQGEVESRKTERTSRMTQAQLDDANVFDFYDVAPTETLSGRSRYTRAARESDALDMAAPESKAAKGKFRIGERITRLITSSTQGRLTLIKKAEALHSALVDAVHKDTGGKTVGNFRLGKTNLPMQMDKDFSEFLASHEHASEEGRAKLIADLSAKYPESTKVLTEMRDMISDTTVDTVRELVSSGQPLSTDLLKSISTMVDQKDHYMSRAYAAFQGVAGRKWAAKRWANYYHHIGRDASTIKNDKKRADVLEVRAAIKTILDSMHIPSDADMDSLTMAKLESLADKYNIDLDRLDYDRNDPDATWLKRDAIQAKLAYLRERQTPEILDDKAEEIAKELMGLTENSSKYAKQLSAMAKDPGTLNKREHVPLEIRRMLGEIELTPGAFLATMGNQAALRARASLVNDLINEPNGDIVITEEAYYALPKASPNVLTTAARKATFRSNGRGDYVRVTGSEWGAMEGMYLRKGAYDKLNETLGTFYSWGEAARMFGHNPKILGGKLLEGVGNSLGFVNRWTKVTTVAGNPVNYMMQYVGSYLNLLSAGMIPLTPHQVKRVGESYIKGNKAAGAYFASVWGTSLPPSLEEAQQYMNIESVELGDIQRILGGKLEDYFDGRESIEDAQIELTKHALSVPAHTLKGVLAGYAIADNWSRLVAFHHRAAILKDMYDAAGVNKSREEILREAGHDTSMTTISPERSPKFISGLEQNGITQYAPYFSEVFRTRVTGFGLAFKDIARANQFRAEGNLKAAGVAANAGFARLLGHTAATIMMPLVGSTKVASRLAGVGVPVAIAAKIAEGITALGGDDEEYQSKRRLLPDTLKYQEIIEAGKNSMGYPAFVGISQKLDPSGPMTDLLRIMAYSEDDVERANALQNYATENLLIIPQIWKDIYGSFKNKNAKETDFGTIDAYGYNGPALKQAFVDASGADPTTVDRIMNPLDNFIPGGMRAWKSKYSPDDLQVSEDDRMANKVFNAIGFRYETFDPSTPLKGYKRKSDEDKDQIKANLNNNLVNISKVSDKAMDEVINDFAKAEIARQTQDYLNVKSLRDWGFDRKQVVQLLKDGSYEEKYAKQLEAGNVVVKISLAGIYDYAQKSRSYGSTKDRDIAKERASTVISRMIEREEELRERGVFLDKSKMPKGWNK